MYCFFLISKICIPSHLVRAYALEMVLCLRSFKLSTGELHRLMYSPACSGHGSALLTDFLDQLDTLDLC